MTESIIFYVFGAIALAGGAGVLLHVRNTVYAALSLLISMLALAVLFVQLQAEFIGVLQVMVYAGAIVVLFLFVIMLLNVTGGVPGSGEHPALAKWLGGVLQIFGALPEDFGGVRSLADLLYGDYLIAVEVSGVLLLAGIVGALVLAKKEAD